MLLTNFLNDDFKRSMMYLHLNSFLECRLALGIKHLYDEQVRVYRLSCETKMP